MDGKLISRFLAPLFLMLALGLAGWWSAAAHAELPFGDLLMLKRVDADPNKEYRLTEDNGPWTIMACSFSGKRAEEQARELAYELRKRYKLKAYTHPMRFDLGDVRGRGIDQFGAPIPVRYQGGDEKKEIAVLVGNYRTIDDPQAQKTLQKLKYSRPRCLELDQSKPTARILAGWRLYAKYASPEKQKKGPMSKAFVTTNPLLPKDYFVPRGIDPQVVEWNRRVTHSLLDCPGKYTVQVATFKGQVIIKQSEIQEIEHGKQLKSELAEAAMKAHHLTEALRMKNWEAYEFHDRYASIVTVGSFDSVGTPRADGKIEINSGIHAVMRTFGAEQTTLPGQPTPVTTLKSVIDIPLDVQPIIVQVPKRSISSEMARGPF